LRNFLIGAHFHKSKLWAATSARGEFSRMIMWGGS
jgi:hypothetical protein